MSNLNEHYKNNSTIQEAIYKFTDWLNEKLCIIYDTPSLHDEKNGFWTVFVKPVITNTTHYNKFGGQRTLETIRFRILMDTNIEDEPRLIDEKLIPIESIYEIGIDTIIKNLNKYPFRVFGMRKCA